MWRAQGSHPPSRAPPKGSNQSFSLPFLLPAESLHGGRTGGNPFLISTCLKSPCHCCRQEMEALTGLLTHNSRAQLVLFFSYGRKQGKSRLLQHLGHACGEPPAQEGSSTHPAPAVPLCTFPGHQLHEFSLSRTPLAGAEEHSY